MMFKKAWIAITTLAALAALPACARSNSTGTTSTPGSGGDGGAGEGGGSGGRGGGAAVCGDGIRATSESCDDGNTTDGDGCSSSCELEMGWTCQGTPTACTPKCGDGLIVGKEGCDDGNTTKADGCSDVCTVEVGYACSGAPSTCMTVCGDGILAGLEQCDDSNKTTMDGCDDKCAVEVGWACVGQPSKCATTCGDGLIAGSEACDDHNSMPGDGCDAMCQVEMFWTCSGMSSACTTPCGDGHLLGLEECDDGNATNGDGCDSMCKSEAGYVCTGMPSACKTVCGDGIIAGSEVCDDGNMVSNDGCNVLCKIEPGWTCSGKTSVCTTICGDGYPAGPETCDDGNLVNGDGCNSMCMAEHGYVCNNIPSICQTVCGDGVIAGSEQCDDGNNVSGDGCSSKCNLQQGFNCAGEPSMCTSICGDGIVVGMEQCDDGNLVNGDCCSSTCQIESGCEIEPNDTPAQATANGPFPANQMWSGAITPGSDVDYFALHLTVATDLKIQTFDQNGPGSCAGINTVLTLYATNGTTVLAINDDGGIPNCSLIDSNVAGYSGAKHLLPGTYFVKVSSFGASVIGGYRVQITFNALCGNGIVEGSEQCDGNGGPPCDVSCMRIPICGDGFADPPETCDDGNAVSGDGCSSTCQVEGVVNEVEPDDTIAGANASLVQITADALILGNIGVVGDKDYYKVVVTAPAVLRFETFQTQFDCASISTTLRLYDINNVQLKTDSPDPVASGIGNCAALIMPFYTSGTYYIEVEQTGNSATIPTYLLQVKYLTSLGNEVEPNDVQAQATATSGVDFAIYGNHQVAADIDYYAVTIPAGKSIRAELVEGDTSKTCESNGIDTYMTMYNSAAATLVSDDDDGRGFCSAIDGTGAIPRDPSAHALAAGTYYLQVKASGSGASSNFNYKLAVTVR